MSLLSPDNLLTAVTGSGYLIAFASVAWAATRELSTPVDGGRKRLTRAGQFSLVLAFVAAMLSTTALALKLNIETAAEEAAKDRKALEDRLAAMRRLEDRRFQAGLQLTGLQYQDLLFKLGQAEARRTAKDIVRNQGLLADIASANEATRFSDARLTQIGLQQEAILKSQPLRSLVARITLAGLPSERFAALRGTFDDIMTHNERDDEFGRAPASVRREIEQANAFRRVFIPGLRLAAGLEGDGATVAVIDLDGFGGLYLPIGYHPGEASNGLFLAERELAALANWDVYKDFEIPPCAMPEIRLDPARRTIEAQIVLAGSCLASSLSGDDRRNPTSFLTRRPRLAVFGAGPDGLAILANDVTRYRVDSAAGCFGAEPARGRRSSVSLELIPNRAAHLAARAELLEATRAPLVTDYDYYDGTRQDYGECITFVGRSA